MSRETTFLELLQLCHEHLFSSFRVQSNPTASTRGSTTSPTGKPCPTWLRPWDGFLERQQIAFDTLFDHLHPNNPTEQPKRLFVSRQYVQDQGRLLSARSNASELSLRTFQTSAVEDIVANVITEIGKDPFLRTQLSLGSGLTFEDHSSALDDNAEDVQARQAPVTPPAKLPPPPAPKYADKICVCKRSDGLNQLLFVIEYKPPHKITAQMLRAGLREMNVFDDVVDRPMIPPEQTEKFYYHAEKLVAAAVAQTYSYMLESGVEYSCLVTGEAIVSLWVPEERPDTVYYHLSEPGQEVETGPGEFHHPRTAIALMLSMCVMALQTSIRSESWRAAAAANTRTWNVDVEKILKSMPTLLKKSPPVSPAFVPSPLPDRVEKSSPYYTRYLKRTKAPTRRSSDESSLNNPRRHGGDDSDDHDNSGGPKGNPLGGAAGLPTRRSARPQGGGGGGGVKQSNWHPSTSSYHYSRPYCTQRCLFGLVQESGLDEDCPHVKSHRRRRARNTHALSKQRLCVLVQRQLARSLDFNCTHLQIRGSRCMMFKITLASHGYTFVAKGTRDVFIPDLQHEGQVYDRLQSIQGRSIPVCLGSIDLTTPWYDLGGVRVIHMLLLAYGGTRVDRNPDVGDLDAQVKNFEGELGRFGVRHEDLACRNMLWNPELGRVLFIDFERSTVDTKATAPISVGVSPIHQRRRVGRQPMGLPKVKSTSFEIYEDQPLQLPLPSPTKETSNQAVISSAIGDGQALVLTATSPERYLTISDAENVVRKVHTNTLAADDLLEAKEHSGSTKKENMMLNRTAFRNTAADNPTLRPYLSPPPGEDKAKPSPATELLLPRLHDSCSPSEILQAQTSRIQSIN